MSKLSYEDKIEINKKKKQGATNIDKLDKIS